MVSARLAQDTLITIERQNKEIIQVTRLEHIMQVGRHKLLGGLPLIAGNETVCFMAIIQKTSWMIKSALRRQALIFSGLIVMSSGVHLAFVA